MSVRRLLPLTLIAVPMLSLAACQTPTPAQRRQLDSMVGRTQVDLVRNFGVPTRTYTADGRTFLAYIDNESSYYPGSYGPGFGDFGYGGGFGGYGGGFGGFGGYGGGYGGGFGGFGGFPPTYYTSTCQTTFEVASDKVTSWTMRGNGC